MEINAVAERCVGSAQDVKIVAGACVRILSFLQQHCSFVRLLVFSKAFICGKIVLSQKDMKKYFANT